MAICNSNVTSGFIDLATFDELEKYLYGGPEAVAYFVRETRKSTWFTQVPVVLSRASGTPEFGQEWSASISRAGDYLLATWLRTVTPEITCQKADHKIRWTRNFMHNLIRECCLTFNDLVAARFDNYHLDFWSAFTVPAGKRNGYNNMIGTFSEMVDPTTTLASQQLNLPLPFFFSRDSGVALPTAALPYNDMRICFSFRNWSELLVLVSADDVSTVPAIGDLVDGAPKLGLTHAWANYAIVSNDERKRMACAPRDILIEQVQTAPRQTFLTGGNNNPSYDIRFSHAIKALFWAARNSTHTNEWSNYTTSSAQHTLTTVDFNSPLAADPISTFSLTYENTQRLSNMGSDYFSLVNPWYHAPVIPGETGYHMYSYSLDFYCLDPMGSTNYGKLTNVSVAPVASTAAISSVTAVPDPITVHGATKNDYAQTYEFVVTCINNNIIRISGGAAGFPVL